MPELTIPSRVSPQRNEVPNGAHHLPADSDPWAIANDPNLDTQTKLQRLHALEWDVRLVQVANEEGMQGRSRLPSLDEILAAMATLGPDEHAQVTATKL